jgi:prepilin signal peptidase PulO-like enzyme (type II secretory pathway)
MFDLFFAVIIFIFGSMIGSFLSCIVYRLEQGKTFLKGRSFCPKCRHYLSWTDLFPVLSYIFLGGKCRYCKQKISPQYPLIELATGLLFVSFLSASPSLPNLIFNLTAASILIIIFVFDLKHYVIPDGAVYLAIGLALVRFFYFGNYENILYALSFSFFFFLLLVLVSRGKWMGVGDVKYALFMAFFLGWPNVLVALFVSFLLGAVVGIFLVFRGKKSMSSEVPFGPFLVIGTFFAMLEGEKIIDWYTSLFLIQ